MYLISDRTFSSAKPGRIDGNRVSYDKYSAFAKRLPALITLFLSKKGDSLFNLDVFVLSSDNAFGEKTFILTNVWISL